MKKIKAWLKVLGPGFVTGASDDDPSGIGTYSQTGAQFGYNQLWTALFSLPFMTAIQEMCGRIGMVTGKGLASILRNHYAKPVLLGAVSLLFIANTVNVGADLGAMASSAQLLLGVPFIWWLLIITVVTVLLEIFVPYPTYARILKYLSLSLFAYIIVAFIIKEPWSIIALKTIRPHFAFNQVYLLNIVAILGTTISPYLFFWEADQEAEEDFELHRIRSYGKGMPKVTKLDLRAMRLDTFVGMLFSQAAMFFIVITAASTLGAHGVTSVQTANQAASALRPLAGQLTYLLFAVGIIGTGLLAVPVLAGSAAYALSESFKWRAGLHYTFKQAHGFYFVIALSTVIGVIVNFVGIKPFQMLYYTAILNGIMAPPLMVLILLVANNKTIMGKHTNSKLSNVMGWVITAVMAVAAIALLATFGHGGGGTPAATATPTPTATASATPTQAPSPSPTASSAAAQPTASGACATAGLKASVITPNGGGTAGTMYYTLSLTNIGQQTCTVAGYPGVSLVNAAGNQLGSPANRATNLPTTSLTLASGQSAYATLALPDAGNYNPGVCSTTSTSLKVYPPNQTASLTTPFAAQACPGWNVTTLHATQP